MLSKPHHDEHKHRIRMRHTIYKIENYSLATFYMNSSIYFCIFKNRS
jgi:hypothetical protein